MVENAIELTNVTKTFRFDKRKDILSKIKSSHSDKEKFLTALDHISFSVEKGKVIGIIGLNGSGKTTLLRTIAGVYLPDSGQIKVHGILAPVLQIGIGFQPELYPQENIIMYGMLLGFKKSEIKKRIDAIIEFAELKKFSSMKLKHFSSGMKARLGFATMSQLDPDILLLDEILAVGDINFREKSFKVFSSFKEKGKTILFSTHSTSTAMAVCDEILFLHKGKILSMGDPKEVIKKYKEMSHQN